LSTWNAAFLNLPAVSDMAATPQKHSDPPGPHDDSYHEVRGAVGAGCGTALIALLVAASGARGFRFGVGPCEPGTACPAVLGVEARTWTTWAFLVATLVVKEALLAYGYTTLRFWLANEVMDRKAVGPIGRSRRDVVAMLVVWKGFQYAASVVDINVAVSGDIQYVVALWAVEVGVYVATTLRAISQRERRTRRPLSEQMVEL
jgi:hypothetical protein